MSKEKEFSYTITLSSAQAREVQNALEAIMRWILRQPEIMREYLPDRLCWDYDAFDISLEKRNAATELLKAANNIMCPYNFANPNELPLKTDQWHRIYGIYQVIRHAIWEAETEEKGYWCVDSDKPYKSGGVDNLPQIEWHKK